jgi:hypothetical protein
VESRVSMRLVPCIASALRSIPVYGSPFSLSHSFFFFSIKLSPSKFCPSLDLTL